MRPGPEALPLSVSPYRAAQERLTQEIWCLNRARLLREEAVVDPFLDRLGEDGRRCLTLLARIPGTLHPALLDIQARLLAAGPAFAWVNLLRFAQTDVATLVGAMAALRDVPVGPMEVQELELSEIDKFCLPERTVHFRTFKIGSG